MENKVIMAYEVHGKKERGNKENKKLKQQQQS